MAISMNQDEKRSAIITAAILSLMFILFMFVGLSLKLPLPDGSYEISFGTSNSGSGEIQPKELTSPVADETQDEVSESSSSAASSEANEMTADDNIVESPKETNPNENITPKEEVKEDSENKTDDESNELDDLAKTMSSSDQSEGTEETPGDQGAKDGTDNNNHEAGGWNGNSLSYGGPIRGEKFIPETGSTDCNQEGKVGVILYVNRLGHVVGEPKFTNEKTTNTADCLVERAINWAKDLKFEANSSAPIQQKILHVCSFKYTN